ncbi:DUF7342 family protein [Natronobiforma cellulositropha]|uniref:DUF7342 family protein n=1 Tax=Natronobiforma cellulositropha TaxID=1679076 RepID=UPI0021D57CED|nr:hypothetical protein [Natronobiforma cellulositropha]
MTDQTREWPVDIDGAERVRHVAQTQTTPRDAEWIAEEADVSTDTAVKCLTWLVDQWDLEVVETTEGTCYKLDGVTHFLRTVRSLAEEHPVEDLIEGIGALSDEIDAWKTTYEVDSLEDLRRSTDSDEFSAEERRERLESVGEWEHFVQLREAHQIAISLQTSLARLHTELHIEVQGSNFLPQDG